MTGPDLCIKVVHGPYTTQPLALYWYHGIIIIIILADCLLHLHYFLNIRRWDSRYRKCKTEIVHSVDLIQVCT